jgi:hypothetical protein
MALESENVALLMDWLADDGPGRSHAGAEELVRKLAALVFQGESDWPNHADRVDAYLDGLRAWFADDGARESRFVALTGPHDDPGTLFDWFLPVVLEWEGRAARSEPGRQNGETAIGSANPNGDGTPGTEFYRLDAATGQYLYAASAGGGDWATYEQRRYSEPTRNDAYGLDCRFDRTLHVYEWYDEATEAWNDQTWADRQVARTRGPASGASAGGPAAEWDENWAMFYRANPGGAYEFADAVIPGERSSGCGEVWQSSEQVLGRRSPESAEPVAPQSAHVARSEPAEALQAEIQAAVEAALKDDPELKRILSDQEIKAVMAELAEEIIGGEG